jgi:hypothetical protein
MLGRPRLSHRRTAQESRGLLAGDAVAVSRKTQSEGAFKSTREKVMGKKGGEHDEASW